MCPWDSSFGSEFDVLLHGKVLFALAVAGRLAYVHFGLPCQSMTWTRSPPLRSCDHVWELPALKGQDAEKVLMGNRLLVFSVQLCFVLHAEHHYFSFENHLGSWTWAVAAVARLHAMPGVATVQVYYDQFGTRYPKPTLFLHNLPLLHKLSVPPRVTPDKAIVLRGEWRFKTSLASPYPPSMTKLMAKLINECLTMKNSASRRECTPLAPASHDYGKPFSAVGPMAPPEVHTCNIEGVDLLAGNMFIPDHVRSAVARAHFTGAIVNEDNVCDDFVPYGLGSKRGWLPSDHVQWALVQQHHFKDQETKLDLKLQLAVKESAALEPEDLDKLRTERLQYLTLRALQLEEERARWITEAPPQLQRMLTSVHGPLVFELCAHCSHDLYLASDLQKGLPFVGVLPRSPDFCKSGGEQVCDLSVAELRAQRAERNTYVLSRVVLSEWSSDLWNRL